MIIILLLSWDVHHHWNVLDQPINEEESQVIIPSIGWSH